jgi:FixJ family two-component response regulator
MNPTIPTIAVIDDDASFGRSLVRLLRAAQYLPVAYESAETFLADAHHDRFDCLLLDVQLHGISGLELQRRLVSEGSTTPAICITSHDDARTREEARAAGCVGFVSKVEPSETMLAAIAEAVSGL